MDSKKDIVYIDVEDDVTGVIGKVKAADQKIVALVPPKNLGTLQSAVNLRLLQKAADAAGKRIVLITNNSGLTALAAGVKIPVAKNLQSKPEIPVAASTVLPADDDVIKGDELPVGELAAVASGTKAVEEPAIAAVSAAPTTSVTPVKTIKESDDDITIAPDALPDLEKETLLPAVAAAGIAKPKKSRVPNFDRFRKWIFIGGGALVAIILFFVLGNIFWSGASVVIKAQTSNEQISIPVTLTADGTTNPDSGLLKSETKTLKKTASVDFTPTGKKNVGEKATGTVKFSTNNISNLGTTIPAGTELTTDDGIVLTTDSSVTIGFTNYQGANSGVTAKSQGTASNGQSGVVSGAPSGINATLVGSTAGGTDKTVTVVSADDVSAATSKLASADTNAAKSELAGQFGGDYVTIDSSFTSQTTDPVSAPAAGSEASSAKLTRDTMYTMSAVAKAQIKTLTTAYLNEQIGDGGQKIYDDGSKNATLSQFITSPSGVMTARVSGTGKVGPNINEDTLKTSLVGKKPAEITSQIKAINGVRDVTVSLSPFWRTTAPAADKITVSFDLGGDSN